eukprot:Sspe_Gene.15715::Locus_5481_Transcript_1_1_Confidence_1.000_Length_1783::g.15715::m.15715/K18764/CCRN4L; nocturnin
MTKGKTAAKKPEGKRNKKKEGKRKKKEAGGDAEHANGGVCDANGEHHVKGVAQTPPDAPPDSTELDPQEVAADPLNGEAVFDRKWIDISGGFLGTKPCFRVAQWNVLADSLARGSEEVHIPYSADGAGTLPGERWIGWGSKGPPHGYQRPHIFRCPPKWLDWEYRGPRVAAEIRRLEADVIALQEVDKWDFLRESLDGFDGTFASKTGFDDGVALLWRTSLFRPADRKIVRFSRGAQVALLQRLLLFDTESTARAIVVVSTHLKAGLHDRFEASRNEQLQAVITVTEEFARGDPIVVLADLNAHPKDLPGMAALAVPSALRRGFASVYPGNVYTVWSGWTDGEVRAAFDHVLFSATTLRCVRLLSLPDVSTIEQEECRLPNPRWPSDHLPLAADLMHRGVSRAVTKELADQGKCEEEVLSTPRTRRKPPKLVSGELCRFYATGSCHYSQGCRFPHSDGRRAERCIYFDSAQGCWHGASCHFLHSSSSSFLPPRGSSSAGPHV